MNESVEKNRVNNKNKIKNLCKICGKKIFNSDCQITMCLKTRHGGEICLSCAHEIEEALCSAKFDDDIDNYYYDDESENLTPQPKISEKVTNIKDNIKNELPNKLIVIKRLKKSIIGQDYAIEKITGMVYRNILSDNRLLRSLPLLIGKSGQGKTEIVTELCELINLPYVIENAKDFSEAGYVGRDPSEMFEDLYIKCGKDISLTNHGVIVIDEFDKLCETAGNERDVSGSGVVNTLLSYLSGISIPIRDKYDNLINYVDTSNIIFIFMGAFEDADKTISLYKIREKRLGINNLGFNTANVNSEVDNTDRVFIAEDMMKYGFSRQIVGRLSIVELNELKYEDYMRLFLYSEISIYRAYRREFLSHGLSLICSRKLKESIVKKAINKKIGVRGLKVVCDEVFLNALEYVEDIKKHSYTKIIFADSAIENPMNYKLR